jgi:hypothetical protein
LLAIHLAVEQCELAEGLMLPLYVRFFLWWWMEQNKTQLDKRTIHVSFLVNIVFLYLTNYHKVLSSAPPSSAKCSCMERRGVFPVG